MKPWQILLVGLLGTIAALTLELWMGWIAIGVALFPAFLVLLGHLFLPLRTVALSVSLNPEIFRLGDGLPHSVDTTISGRQITLEPLMKWLEFRLERRNFALLAGLVVIPFAVIARLWPERFGGPLELIYPGHIFYYIAIMWFMVIGLALQWFRERLILRRCVLAIAEVEFIGQGRWHTNLVRYNFVDQNGERWGNTVHQYAHHWSDLELFFFDPLNPQRSLPASALLFHRPVWESSSAGNSVRKPR